MEIPILIRPVAGNGFQVASSFPLVVEGATRDEALEKFRRLVQEQLQAGAELTSIEIKAPMNKGWEKIIGMHENDPFFDEYLQAIRDYRQQVEDDPDRL